MAFSKIDICNKALNRLGAKPIASLTENTTQAVRLNYIYNTVRDDVLRNYFWPCANRIETLNSISGETVPGWNYLYLYPPKCMRIKKIFQDNTSTDPAATEYKELISPTSNQKALASNITPAYVEYTFQVDDPTFYDADFVEAFALKLAADVAWPVTGNSDLQKQVQSEYLFSVSEAKRTAGQEKKSNTPRSSSFEDSRA